MKPTGSPTTKAPIDSPTDGSTVSPTAKAKGSETAQVVLATKGKGLSDASANCTKATEDTTKELVEACLEPPNKRVSSVSTVKVVSSDEEVLTFIQNVTFESEVLVLLDDLTKCINKSVTDDSATEILRRNSKSNGCAELEEGTVVGFTLTAEAGDSSNSTLAPSPSPNDSEDDNEDRVSYLMFISPYVQYSLMKSLCHYQSFIQLFTNTPTDSSSPSTAVAKNDKNKSKPGKKGIEGAAKSGKEGIEGIAKPGKKIISDVTRLSSKSGKSKLSSKSSKSVMGGKIQQNAFAGEDYDTIVDSSASSPSEKTQQNDDAGEEDNDDDDAVGSFTTHFIDFVEKLFFG